ncbi:YIP1 family protein [Ovoidimarina sediminis]|uniref:YIP1 family protein n=1 Tax=Ovoidimarina sediminis TaxID=3079856 RepID=UPI00291030E3|nr:YIP1 family protein [Rhodophyticola sp. MJ-SS7]MDU8945602.1 YIP1 family protein [Rhodophyticola sp. MJ-SS7]
MSVTWDILRTYRAPREVVRRRAGGVPSEARALAVLLAGCLLLFVARLPALRRQAFDDPSVPFEGLVAGALVGVMFMAPLLFYVLAALSHLVAKLVGGAGTWYGARVALFWALLAAAPAFLLSGLVQGFVGQGVAVSITGTLAGAVFLVFWVMGLIEVERRQPA